MQPGFQTLCSMGRRALGALVVGLVLGQPADAANQGATGPTSTGAVDITLTTGISSRISGLVDLALGNWTGAGDLSGDQDICIGRTGVGFFGSGSYRIRADGDGDTTDINAFTLTNGVDLIYYDVFFNDQTGLAGRQALTGGQMLSGQGGSGFSEIFNWLFGCVVRNANVSVVVPQANLQGAAGGAYTGTLTLVLIPD